MPKGLGEAQPLEFTMSFLNNLSYTLQGVTFLAFGNGAPDIFSSLAGFTQNRDQSGVQLVIQALFGKLHKIFSTNPTQG